MASEIVPVSTNNQLSRGSVMAYRRRCITIEPCLCLAACVGQQINRSRVRGVNADHILARALALRAAATR